MASRGRSPREHGGFVWLHDSGSGHLCRVDPQTGRRDNVAFCPGLPRGLAFMGNYAVVTLSLPRHGRFQGLALDDELARREASPWCGLMVIDTRHGDVVEWVRLNDDIVELFDVAVVPMTRCPTGIEPDSPELQDAITFRSRSTPRLRLFLQQKYADGFRSRPLRLCTKKSSLQARPNQARRLAAFRQ